MRPTKEECNKILAMLEQNQNEGNILSDAEYEDLESFLLACRAALPTLAAAKRDQKRKRSKTVHQGVSADQFG